MTITTTPALFTAAELFGQRSIDEAMPAAPAPAPAANTEPAAAPVAVVRVDVVLMTDGSGTIRVHAAGCRDIARERRRAQNEWAAAFDSLRSLVLSVFTVGEFEDVEPDGSNWADYLAEFDVAPCVNLPAEATDPAAEVATAPAYGYGRRGAGKIHRTAAESPDRALCGTYVIPCDADPARPCKRCAARMEGEAL